MPLRYLGPVSCFSHPPPHKLLSAHHRKWLQPDISQITGIILLPGCSRGSEIQVWRTGSADICDSLVYWCDRKYSISQNHYYKTPHYPFQVDTQSWGPYPTVTPFAWQSNKAILTNFTQNSVSEIWFSVEYRDQILLQKSEVAQSRLTLCDPMCSLPGFSVHGIFQARVLEWVDISFSRGSSQPRDQTRVSHIVGRRFTLWATREATASSGKPLLQKQDISVRRGKGQKLRNIGGLWELQKARKQILLRRFQKECSLTFTLNLDF